MLRKPHADVVAERADHDPLHHPLQVLRDVVDGFAFAEIDVRGGQEDGISSELLDPDRECGAGTQ
jgi:hypothetical protein